MKTKKFQKKLVIMVNEIERVCEVLLTNELLSSNRQSAIFWARKIVNGTAEAENVAIYAFRNNLEGFEYLPLLIDAVRNAQDLKKTGKILKLYCISTDEYPCINKKQILEQTKEKIRICNKAASKII